MTLTATPDPRYTALATAAGVTLHDPKPRRSSRTARSAAAGTEGRRRWVIALIAGEVTAQTASLASWWMLGSTILDGRGLPAATALGWATLIATAVAGRAAATWAAGRAGIAVGVRARRRLIDTILTVDPAATRDLGVGRLLGTVLEANVLETALVNGYHLVTLGAVNLAAGTIVLAATGQIALLGALAAWAAAAAATTVSFARGRRRWYDDRHHQTATLIERLLGHRTVQVLDNPTARHHTDTATLAEHEHISRRADRAAIALHPAAGRAWTVAATAVLAATATGGTTSQLLAAFGAIYLIATGADYTSYGAADLVDAHHARTAVTELCALPTAPTPTEPTHRTGSLIATNIGHQHQPDQPPVLHHLNVAIAPHDRIVLTGPSGSGKTTLATLLAGLDLPTTGNITPTATVAYVPQHDDNHIFLGSVAYNLLLGVAWPPQPDHLDRAEHLCAQLGLGLLLERMPSGIFENIGETGWQLSHGERARIYLARALLQNADVTIIDESFGTLDPHNHHTALAAALHHTRATILIAHP